MSREEIEQGFAGAGWACQKRPLSPKNGPKCVAELAERYMMLRHGIGRIS